MKIMFFMTLKARSKIMIKIKRNRGELYKQKMKII